jgi:hypothetical protein
MPGGRMRPLIKTEEGVVVAHSEKLREKDAGAGHGRRRRPNEEEAGVADETQCPRAHVEAPVQAIQGMEQARVMNSEGLEAKQPEAKRGRNSASTPPPSNALCRDASSAHAGALAHDVPAAAIAHPVPSDSDDDSGVSIDTLQRTARLLAHRTAEAAKQALNEAVHRPCNRPSAIALHAEGCQYLRQGDGASAVVAYKNAGQQGHGPSLAAAALLVAETKANFPTAVVSFHQL